MADPVRTKVVVGVTGTGNANSATAMTNFNTAMAAAIAAATPLATYPIGSNSQSTQVGAPTDPSTIVSVGNICCLFDGTLYSFSSIISYYKYV